jgi:hypothetical protein
MLGRADKLMPRGRLCSGTTSRGEPCNATPRGDTGLCLWHDPALTEEANAARRLGGQKRRREATVLAAFDLEGLANVGQIQRIVEIVVTDLLGMENSIARARSLLSAAQVAAKLLETGEFEERLAQLESVLEPRAAKAGKGKR